MADYQHAPPAFLLACNNCQKFPAPHVCSGCFDVAYCSIECQMYDWQQRCHFLECPLRACQPLRNSSALPHESFLPEGFQSSFTPASQQDTQVYQLMAQHMPLAPLQLGIAESPENASVTITKKASARMCDNEDLRALEGTSFLQEGYCAFFNHFQPLQTIGNGEYGVVLLVTDQADGETPLSPSGSPTPAAAAAATTAACTLIPKRKEYVAKIEPLEELRLVDGKQTIVAFDGESWKRDLVTHLQISRMPPAMQWNVVMLHDWTRCRVRRLLTKLPDLLQPLARRMMPDEALVYQFIIMERAEGDAHSLVRHLFKKMSRVQKLSWFREFVIQIYATLAQYHARIGFEHNDLQLRNILFSVVPSKHQERSIFYQLPSLQWMVASLGEVNNCMFKLCDFGLSCVNYWTVENLMLTPRALTPFNEYDTAEERAKITERFDLHFIVRNFSERYADDVPEIVAFANDIKRDYMQGETYDYDPQRLLLTHPLFATNVMTFPLGMAEQAMLAEEGHIVIPYMPFLSNEMEPVNEAMEM